MFDGFSSLLKPENTSEFSPRFSVSFSRGRRNEFSPSSLQVASGENFWGFCEAIEKSRGNRKKLVIAMVWGDGGLRSAAVEIRGPSTQNPLVATSCGFESHRRHHEKSTCESKCFFQLNPPSRVGEIIFDDEIPCGDEIRLDGGRVDLISSAKQISSEHSEDFIDFLRQ